MSWRSISLGKLRWRVSRTRVGASVGSQFHDIGFAAPAEMRDLAHDRGTMAVDALGELPEIRNDAVARDVDLTAAQLELGDTIDEPPNMVRARPPLAFSS